MFGMKDLLKIQVEQNASDLHISAGNPPLLRVSGDIKPLNDTPLTAEITHDLLYEIMRNDQQRNFEEYKDIDFGYEVQELQSRFRVNVFMDRHGLAAVFRLVPSKILTAAQLDLPPVLLELAQQRKGLVVVTGATGSGKSTTLAAMVDFINKTRKEHILTVEDPIEFVHTSQMSLINQREVGVHTQSFAVALRAALREDPDVILVGEMRDLETMELAITAAETGHLVLATLHTNTAAKTVERMINVFPANQQAQIRAMLSESLRGVVAQNLLRTPDGKRTGAFEVLINTSSVSSLIREGKAHQILSAMQTGKADGMITMEDAIRGLVADGKVSINEAKKFITMTPRKPGAEHGAAA